MQTFQLLDKGDTYYVFDFNDRLKEFTDDLRVRNFGAKCKIVLAGNSSLEWDSYNWNLSNLVFRMREQGENGIFDAVYLDGAHTLFHDGLAVCLLKELIKDGGFLVLDDLFWSHNKSSERIRQRDAGRVTKEQMADMQVLRVQELFLTKDPNWERFSLPENYRGVFKKRPH